MSSSYCNECDVYFKTWEALQQHLRDSSKYHPYCKFCERIFSSEHGYNMHTASKHAICQACNRTFNSQNELENHYRDSPKHPNCSHCDGVFVDDEAYRQHLRAIHKECLRCVRNFVSQDAIEHHYRDSASHPTCYICHRGFADDQAFRQHQSAVHRRESRRQRSARPPPYSTYVTPPTYVASSFSSEDGEDFQPRGLRALPSAEESDSMVQDPDIPLPPDLSETALTPDLLLTHGLRSLGLDSPVEHRALDPFENRLSREQIELSHVDEMGLPSSSPDQLATSDVRSTPPPPTQTTIYKNLLSLIRAKMSPDDFADDKILQDIVNRMTSSNTITLLVHSHAYRVQLLSVASGVGLRDDPNTRVALDEDGKDLFGLLQYILDSKAEKEAVLDLKNTDASQFVDVIQNYLDRSFWGGTNTRYRDALRLQIKLSEASEVLPPSLVIEGVSYLEREPRFCGGFADIYQAKYQGPDSAPQMVALKRLRISQKTQQDRELRRRFCREALVWKTLQHPHILPFLGVDSGTFHSFIGMVSPWIENGTILQYMEDRGPLNVNVDKCLFQVALGVEYLHSKNIVHGDLHATNILIDGEGNACLTDFGLVGFVEATAATHTSCPGGALRWMAPELHWPEKFGSNVSIRTPASDVYAFAFVCIEVHTRSQPFSDDPVDSRVLFRVINGERPIRPCNTPDSGAKNGFGGDILSDYLWDLMEDCWKQIPSDRPCMREVVRSMKERNFGSA